MSRVTDLVPGDIVQVDAPLGSPSRGCFIAQTEHPVWPPLRLVIWRLAGGRWSHDALDARQEVGEVVERGGTSQARAALLGEGEWRDAS